MCPEVSIVVLAHNHWSHTRRLLVSLSKTRGVLYETIVVDCGSGPEAREHLIGFSHSEAGLAVNLRLLLLETNVGIARGRNRGADEATGAFLIFLDNDTEVLERSWLRELRDALLADSRIGVAGGVLVSAERDAISFMGGRADSLGRVTFTKGVCPDDLPTTDTVSTQFCLGACLMVSSELWNTLGGFDLIFNPMDYEDIDFCLRSNEEGRPCVIVTKCVLVHIGHVTTSGDDFDRVRQYLISGRRFVHRWGGLEDSEELAE